MNVKEWQAALAGQRAYAEILIKNLKTLGLEEKEADILEAHIQTALAELSTKEPEPAKIIDIKEYLK